MTAKSEIADFNCDGMLYKRMDILASVYTTE